MQFNSFNSSFNSLTNAKKARGIPSITFSNPSLVTTTTHWVVDVSYRVFLLEGPTTSAASTTTTATISNWESSIKIFYLVIGSGGNGSNSGSGLNNSTYGSSGGGGAGGFLYGNVNVSPFSTNRTISFSVGGVQYGETSSFIIPNGVNSTTQFKAIAGGGGNGNPQDYGGNGQSVTGTVSRNGSGSGGGAFYAASQNYGGGSGYTSGGASANSYWGGGGGGAGGNGGTSSGNSAGAKGIGASVPADISGIYQKFGSTIFCVGGSGGRVDSTTGGSYSGSVGNGNYGSGAGGASNTGTTNKQLGNKGAIAIAISVNDVPP